MPSLDAHPPPPFDLGVFDLDGTVLQRGRGITDRTVRAIEALRRRGTRIVVATGRRYEGACEHAARLGLRDMDPVICYGGSMVRQMDGETLLHQTLPRTVSVEFLDWADRRGLHARVFPDGRIALGPDTRASREYLSRPNGPGVFKVQSPVGWLAAAGEAPTKIAVTDDPSGVNGWLEEARATFAGRLFVTRSHPYYVEVMAPGSTKSAALQFLCKGWKIEPTHVIAFGDADNDIDMLRFAGHGVAVDPMSEEVREAADDLAPPARDDGVARYLEKLLGAGR